MAEPRKRVYWHEAFYEAVRLELVEFKANLHFEVEYHLTKEALRMDMLIVKTEKTVDIQKDFAQIFKTHNILEYKSGYDHLSVGDYNKVIAYALLYATFNKVSEDDITITLVSSRYPRELFRHLKSKHYEVTEPYSGIYYVHGDKFSCQVLHITGLSDEDSVFIKSLRSNLKPEDIKKLLAAYKGWGGSERKDVYINRIMDANARAFGEVLSMSRRWANFDMFLREAAEQNGWFREWEEKLEQLMSEKQEMELEKQEMIRRMIEDGVPPEKVEKWAGIN